MPDTPVYDALRDALRAEEPVVLATVTARADDAGADGGKGGGSRHPELGAKLLAGPDGRVVGSLGDPDLDRVVTRDALGELESGLTSTRHYGVHGEAREDTVSVFIESFAPPPRMIIFGAVDFTAALARVAKVLGYRVAVCDARAVFATRARFPMADDVVNDWPDRYLDKVGDDLGPRDVVCVLTHDAKFDVPAIVGALATKVGYLGVMGSRRTHDQRVARLREAGVDDAGLARLHSPIGLDIGARTPEETAISICSEIISERTGRRAASLRETAGPIH
jgi:xanthine dehydrogenase accessory factor